jgi:PBP1b-binding outer membrane lipoprotein LpoB
MRIFSLCAAIVILGIFLAGCSTEKSDPAANVPPVDPALAKKAAENPKKPSLPMPGP